MQRKFRILSAIVVVVGAINGPAGVPAEESSSGSTSAHANAFLEGRVKKINPEAGTVEVSIGKFGLWSKTLEVSDTTDIRMDGRKVSLEDLQANTNDHNFLLGCLIESRNISRRSKLNVEALSQLKRQ